MSKKLIAIASIVGFTLALGHSSAFAALTKDEQACINAMNKNLGKVAKKQGKEGVTCIKNASKGKELNPQACQTLDAKGKVAKAKAKTLSDETKKCVSGAPIGYTSGATVNTTAMDEEVNLVEDIFGANLNPVISTAKLEGGCQATVIKDVQKIVDTKLKEWAKWKKTELKNGAMAAAALENCLGQDPKGKIAKAVAKLGTDITKKCPGVNTTTALPGECAGLVGNALRDCLDERAECRVCLMANAADNLNIDCDLFDDGLANGSCGAFPAINIGTHKCSLAAASNLIVHGGLPLPPLPATGAIDVICGVTGPDGKAPCDCEVQAPGFGPLSIAGILWACVKPAVSASCPTGEVDCNGGNQLGLNMQGNRNIGACASNAACAASCAAFCAPSAVFAAQCEGFCTLGAQMACLTDAACGAAGQGSCNGPDGVGLGNICDCTCLNDATGGPSDPGDLACQLAFNLTVEPQPGNGLACDGADVSITIGDTCSPLSTQSATAALNNGNNAGLVFPPPAGFSVAGVPTDCTDLATSDTTGVNLVGAAMFYSSAIGDLNVELDVVCQ